MELKIELEQLKTMKKSASQTQEELVVQVGFTKCNFPQSKGKDKKTTHGSKSYPRHDAPEESG